MVQYVDCARPSSSSATQQPATIARTNSYVAQGGHTGAGESDIDTPTAVAIFTGLLNPPSDVSSLVNLACVTGNCTFPRFQTVGMCHACQDITGSVQNRTGLNGSDPAPIKNYTLQNDDDGEVTAWVGREVIFAAAAPARVSTLSNVMELQVLSLGGPYTPSASPVAYGCQMYPCVRTYESSVASGRRSERVVDTARIGQNQLYFADQERELFKLGTASVLPFRTYNNNTGNGNNGDNDGTSTPARIPCTPQPSQNAANTLVKIALSNIDAAPDSIPTTTTTSSTSIPASWYPAPCAWSMGFSSASVLRAQLSSELSSATMSLTGGVATGPLVAKNLWLNGTTTLDTVDKFVGALADVLTANMRNRGSLAPDEYALGTVEEERTCVAVTWGWFAYPAALVFFGVVFLVVLVCHTPRGTAGRLWKSSSLALLFARVDERVVEREGGGGVGFDSGAQEMKDVARGARMQLLRDGDGRPTFALARYDDAKD